jgi:hypothetical protein
MTGVNPTKSVANTLKKTYQQEKFNLRISIIGDHEYFGLNDLSPKFSKRLFTVKCLTPNAVAFFISKQDFFIRVNT